MVQYEEEKTVIKKLIGFSPHLRESKTALDPCQWNLESGFHSKNFPDSGFTDSRFP